MSSSREAIHGVLTNDSSLDGYDGDYRAEVLRNANKADLAFVREELSRGDELPCETLSRLRIEGKL